MTIHEICLVQYASFNTQLLRNALWHNSVSLNGTLPSGKKCFKTIKLWISHRVTVILAIIIYNWVSGARGPCQIYMDLTDTFKSVTYRPRIYISYRYSHRFSGCILNLQISWVLSSPILMDPLSPLAGSVRFVWIWLGPQVSDTLNTCNYMLTF